MSRRPPRLARWLLARRLPAEVREYALGDLQEEYEVRHARDPKAARAWLRRQARRALTARRPAGENPAPTLLGRVRAARLDVTFATRALRRAPLFTALAAVTFALGIGANTTIYTLLDLLVLRGLPLAEADRLVVVRNGFADGRPGRWNPSFPQYQDFVEATTTLQHLGAWQDDFLVLTTTSTERAQRVHVTAVTAELLALVGATTTLGRGIVPDDDRVDAPQAVALLSHRLWVTRFGGDASLIGAEIRLDAKVYTLVGVLASSFDGAIGGNVLPATPTDVWIPYRQSFAAQGMHLRGLHNVGVIGVLAPGLTVEQAMADIGGVAAAWADSYPDDANQGAFVEAAQEAVVAPLRRPLMLLFGAVCFVLLIACTNVANLLLGRASGRRREFAVRAALGAGRGRLVRQLMVESVILAGLGSALGWAGAVLLLRGMIAFELVSVPRVGSAAPDLRVMVFVAAASLAGALLFGLAPALRSTDRALYSALRTSDRSATRGDGRIRRWLVVAEIALALVLVVGAGLMLRSFAAAVSIDPGFDPERILTARLQLPMEFVDADWPRAVSFFRELVSELDSLPGVATAAAGYWTPVDPGWNNAFVFADRPPPEPGTDDDSALFRPVTPGYFETAGIPLLRGRTFTARDDDAALGAVIVNEAFVRRYFDADDPVLGTRIDYGNWWGAGPEVFEIVGVVADVRFNGRTENVVPATYFPHAQQPVREMAVLLRTHGAPLDLTERLRAVVAKLDPMLPVDRIATLASRLADTEGARRSMMILLGGFAALALLLAAVGVYGVMAFLVGQRTREVGIRMALGAGRSRIRSMILRDGLVLTGSGVVLGLLGAAALARFAESHLYGIEPTDGATFAAAAAFLAAVSLLASWIPARRAARVDAMVSLRAD